MNLLNSGFDAVPVPAPIGQLPTPQNVRLVQGGLSGELSLRFDRVDNAANYTVESSIDSEGPWTDRGLSPNTRVTLDGFTPGKVYWARVRANGTQPARASGATQRPPWPSRPESDRWLEIPVGFGYSIKGTRKGPLRDTA